MFRFWNDELLSSSRSRVFVSYLGKFDPRDVGFSVCGIKGFLPTSVIRSGIPLFLKEILSLGLGPFCCITEVDSIPHGPVLGFQFGLSQLWFVGLSRTSRRGWTPTARGASGAARTCRRRMCSPSWRLAPEDFPSWAESLFLFVVSPIFEGFCVYCYPSRRFFCSPIFVFMICFVHFPLFFWGVSITENMCFHSFPLKEVSRGLKKHIFPLLVVKASIFTGHICLFDFRRRKTKHWIRPRSVGSFGKYMDWIWRDACCLERIRATNWSSFGFGGMDFELGSLYVQRAKRQNTRQSQRLLEVADICAQSFRYGLHCSRDMDRNLKMFWVSGQC